MARYQLSRKRHSAEAEFISAHTFECGLFISNLLESELRHTEHERSLRPAHLQFGAFKPMPTANPLVSPVLIRHLTAEINRLTEEQTDALRNARFFGMSEDDVRQFEKRSRAVHELVRELEMINSRRHG